MAAGPTRTCVGCRASAHKGALVRVVRTATGGRVDPTGAAPGRGAYVHRSAACLDRALARNTLARALRADLAEDEVGRLRMMIEGDA
ncbi:MAG TPA: YlxR family protein [Actinomycetota bacterium]|nr:YlxR family protein [Actinomycetota bacterium]